jgi:aminopeptidase N
VLRPHRLAVGGYDLVDGRLRRTRRVELDVAGARTDVPGLVGAPRPALLLVNDDDLAYAKIRLDDVSLATAVDRLRAFDDALPRSLVLSSAWDMTRDGELGARSFVDLVLGNVDAVDDPSVALHLLRQLASTLVFYVAPAHRSATRARAADAVRGLLEAAPPGSDRQLLFARSFAAHALTPDQVAVAAALLSGDRTIEGLVVDTDMRWTLLTALVAAGAAGEERIAAELERDPTSSGQVHAAGARAAVPTPSAKAEAWKLVVEQGELPNAVQEAVIGGFGRVNDVKLLEPFVKPYFAALAGVWQSRTNEMATQIVTGLYPSQLASPELLERTERWLAQPAEPALKRLVVEGRDGVARALKAQARDAADA